MVINIFINKMGEKMEMSLDDIIKTTRGNRVGGRGRGRVTNHRGSFNRVPLKNEAGGGNLRSLRGRGGVERKRFFKGGENGYGGRLSSGMTIGGMASSKLMISNLDFGVSEQDIRELFSDFGPMRNATIHYNKAGRSLGTADVTFERAADAIKAMKQYNSVPLDGRPMNIQLATSDMPINMRGRTVSYGVGSAPRQQRSYGSNPRKAAGSFQRGGRGQRSGASNGSRRGGKAQTKSVEELDAELDAYVNKMK